MFWARWKQQVLVTWAVCAGSSTQHLTAGNFTGLGINLYLFLLIHIFILFLKICRNLVSLMHLKSTTIPKCLWKEKVGTEKGVMSVSSGDQSKEKLLAGAFQERLDLAGFPDRAELVSGEGFWCLLWVQLVVLNYRAASLLRRKSSLRISVSRNCWLKTFSLKSPWGVTLSPAVIRLEEAMVRIYLPVWQINLLPYVKLSINFSSKFCHLVFPMTVINWPLFFEEILFLELSNC